MKPLRARYKKIEQVVLSLLQKHAVSKAPVPIDVIATGCGAVIRYEHFNNEVSGLILRNGAAAIIGVEKKQPKTRQRFTIAHELGHLLLHRGDELRVDREFRMNLRSPTSSTAEDVEEIEANAFAAALLMPIYLLQNDVKKRMLDVEDEDQIRGLAAQYEVSQQAMTIRLANLMALRRLSQ